MTDAMVKTIYADIFKKIKLSDIDLFLCGGASSKSHTSTRDELRVRLEKNKRVSIFYPEDMFMELLNRKKYDLLTMEGILADNSDLIIIVCESPGSFAELGAFVNNKKTLDKVVVLLHTKYKNAKSFITQGPVQLVKKKNKFNVMYYNNDLDELEKQLIKYLNANFWFRRIFVPSVKEINLISGQYYFIMTLLYFYSRIPVKELFDAVKKIYISNGFEEDRFEMIFDAATRRMYKQGILLKKEDSHNVKFYELTTKGCTKVRLFLKKARIEERDRAINKIRLQIMHDQYC